MKAIETCWNGYRFRSRLEARWAVFLTSLHVPFEYEPEGFILDNGMWYLPDFRVKCWGKRGDYSGPPFNLYIEVKGQMTLDDQDKICSFTGFDEKAPYDNNSKDQKKPPLLIVDRIPRRGSASDSDAFGSYDHMPGSFLYPFNYETIDGDYFAAYPAATEDGKFYLWGDDSSYVRREDERRVMDAYDRARMMQFEHMGGD